MEERLRRFLEDWTNTMLEDYKGKLPSGNLKDSITSRITLDLSNIRISLYLNDYWIYVENGRKPGKFPPLNKMLEISRNIIPKPYILPNGKSVIPNEKQLAFLIGRSIAENGMEPTNYLSDSLNKHKDRLINGLTKILKEEFINIIIE